MPLYLLSKDSFLGKVPVLPKIETFAGVFDGVFSAELILKLFEGLFRAKIKKEAKHKKAYRPIWPMIILNSPKGWTGPKIFESKQIEGSFRAHQVPITLDKTNKKNLALIEEWLKSYHPEELFTDDGKLINELKPLIPPKGKRMGENKNANGGLLYKPLKTPDFRKYAINVIPGKTESQDMMELGKYIRDIIKFNEENRNFH